jgi:hypothetical protein
MSKKSVPDNPYYLIEFLLAKRKKELQETFPHYQITTEIDEKKVGFFTSYYWELPTKG